MRRWFSFLLVVAIVAVAAHAATVIAVPRAIMSVAMKRLNENASTEAPGWRHAPRTTPESRAIVRPSPDLAYSACVYDLREGPMTITMAPSDDYWSLSLYAANSDNFFTRNDVAAPDGVAITLVQRGAARPGGADEVVESPSVRGIALQRRLAPTAAAFANADASRRSDRCERFGG